MVFKGIFMLAVGIYAGIYIDQNYQVPRVDDPQGLWQKLSEFVEQYKKDLPKKPSDKS